MRLKSITGITYHVRDVEKTADFYEKLGFIITKRDDVQISVRLNWFWLDFVKQDRTALNDNGGQFLYISVDGVDAFHKEVVENGLEAGEAPHDTLADRREFLVTDPDGYQLVFFEKNR